MHGATPLMATNYRKRNKLKAAVAQTAAARVHDRRAAEIGRGVIAIPVVVDDPYERGAKITVTRNTRNDPLAQMHSHGQIDDAQFAAGRRLENAYQATEVGGARAIDTTKEAVDGGRFPEPLSEAYFNARKVILEANAALGRDNAKLLGAIFTRGLSIELAAIMFYGATRQDREFCGRLFRECLNTLAVEFGLAMREGRGGR
jgi:hypothetical protein